MAVKRSTSIGANEPINPSMARRLGFHLIVVGPIITNKHLPLVVLPLTVVAMNAPPLPGAFHIPYCSTNYPSICHNRNTRGVKSKTTIDRRREAHKHIDGRDKGISRDRRKHTWQEKGRTKAGA